MKLILPPSSSATFGFLLSFGCSSGLYAATTVIDLSVGSITQPYTNSTDVITNGSQFGFRVFDFAAGGANQSDQGAGTGGQGVGISSVTNRGNITINSFGPGEAQAILFQSYGGRGGDYTGNNDNHNAGSGGNAGNVTADNYGKMNAKGNFDGGATLFWAESVGGGGGSSTNNKSQGGNGGIGGSVSLANYGELSIGNGDVTGGSQFHGILGISKGGFAGSGNSGASGGASSNVRVVAENSSTIRFDLRASDQPQVTDIYGILAESTGLNGEDSMKQNQNGGNGGFAGFVAVQAFRGNLIEIDARGRTIAPGSAGIGAFATGGDGGKAANGDSNNISLAGLGGNTGNVSVDSNSIITVQGDGLLGINAEARGGQGGGGTNNEKSFSNNGGSAGQVNVTLGGDASQITTNGIGSTGVRAVAIGGDGGTTPTSNQDIGGTAGDGGDGGAGGAVNVSMSTNNIVLTTGADSTGIIAGSQGGNGGDGGELSTTTDAAGDGSGDGGFGAAGGDISVQLEDGARIRTTASGSAGIVAVSSGGNGGDGGKIKEIFSGDGGKGGAGGNSGAVDVHVSNSASLVETFGDSSSGIIARSLSGSGGFGGDESVTASGDSGSGGRGGDAEGMTVRNDGSITTAGADSYGILAQGFSGGGGGSGDGSSVFKTNIDQAGTSGNVGVVDVLNFGSISTLGDNSYGVLAQSISGSGGAAGDSDLGIASLGGNGAFATNGGAISFDHNGDLTTAGDGAHGVILQTVGGGGGDGGSAAGLVSIGGSGTGGGSGGAVTSELFQSRVTTTGSQAIGFLGQSIGGGGGNGGDAVANGPGLAVALGGTAGGGGNGGSVDLLSSANISTGGGVTNVPDQNNPGVTNTLAAGSRSVGIVLQSIGGGGGNGGAANSLSVGPGLSSATALGGSGGDGGNGGSVTLTTEGGSIRTGQYDASKLTSLNTLPTDAIGILAQSIGGGGGNGGSSFAEALAIAVQVPGTDTSVGATLAFSAGGTGGNGGNAGGVLIDLTQGTSLMTEGQGSHGVLAQGIGGGGGNGGDSSAFAATLGYANTDSPSVAVVLDVTLGGDGGVAGNGGTVRANLGNDDGSSASVITVGDFSNGVTAQSIGGGGGNAGIGGGTTENYGGSTSVTATIGLGSSGGAGGRGGEARIDLDSGSMVTTYGDGSNGLLVQSIGGGGGTSQGGTLSLGTSFSVTDSGMAENPDKTKYDASLDATLGATGGGGGDAGDATAFIADAGTGVTTFGNDSSGIVVQSIGGGGGIAGAAGSFASPDVPAIPDGSRLIKLFDDGAQSQTTDRSYSANLTLGSQKSGQSGQGNNATFDDQGGMSINTHRDWSHGVLVQSISGGGGKAGSAVATGQGVGNQIDLRLGGSSSSGSTSSQSSGGSAGGLAQAFLTGTRIQTGLDSGYSSLGLVLQSIGGGGGIVADNSDSATGRIVVGYSGASAGDPAGAVFGNAGVVNITGTASIDTFGFGGHAVVMQSIGAGGGIGGAGTSSVNAFDSSVSLEVGGNAGSVGIGEDVFLGNGTSLQLQTSGDHSYGLLAQSIGGGGGLGAVVDPKVASFVGNRGDNTAPNSRGGSVTLDLANSSIRTSGLNAHGVVAQSIGGGGGIAGYSSNGVFGVSNPTAGTGVGDGGSVDITLNSQGTITTSGDRAHGILAQSIAGGGGILNGIAGNSNLLGSGSAGSVSVQVDGNISVTGDGSYGVFFQQRSPGSGVSAGNVRVGGTVTSLDTAVVVDSINATVQIDSGGTVTGPVAIQRVGQTSFALEIVNNGHLNGSIVGDVIDTTGTGVQNDIPSAADLAFNSGAASMALVNTGEFIAGPSVQADVRNRGLVRIGQPTRLNGDFTQTSAGTLLFETDFAADLVNGDVSDMSSDTTDLSAQASQRTSSDALAASVAPPVESGRLIVDGDADLSGKIQIDGSNVNGNREIEVLRVVNGDFNHALEIDDSSSLLFSFRLRQSGNRLLVRSVADFSPAGLRLSKNAVAAGNYLERAYQAQGNEGFLDLFSALETLATNGSVYGDSLEQLTPGAGIAFASRELWDQQALGEAALGDKVLRGNSARPVEVQSMWAKTSGGSFDGDTYDLDSFSTLVGGQWEYSPGFFLGGAIGYGSDNLNSHDRTVTGDGDSVLGALTAKYESGAWSFAAALTGSISSNDVTRHIRIPGQTADLKGSPDYSGFGLMGQVGYTFHNERAYVRPMLTAGLVHVRAEGYTESGTSDLRLRIEDESQTALVVTPGFEAGMRSDLSNGMTLRTYVSGGLSFSTVDEFSQKSSFAEGPVGIGNFNTSLPQDDVVARIATGFQVQFTEALSGYAQYQGEFSDSVSSNGAGVGLLVEF